jgi:hypothetical protein
MRRVHLSLLGMILVGLAASARLPPRSDCPRGTLPAYSHNDYLNAHPLFDALALGYRGVEADVFLVKGELQLGHERRAAEEDGRFETRYLAPLRSLVARCGTLTADGQPFLLNVEIKEDSRATFDSLVALLERYSDLLTAPVGNAVAKDRPPPVKIVLVGWYPPGFADSVPVPLWRQTRLNRPDIPPADAADRSVGLISLEFRKEMGRWWVTPAKRRRWLSEIRATKAAFPAVPIRAYAVPVNERVYRELLESGVDLIGTNNLSETARLLGKLPDAVHALDRRSRTGSP